MIRGLYTAAAGMLAAQTLSGVIADNAANVNTPGYKEETASSEAFPTMLIERLGGGSDAAPALLGSAGTGVAVERVTKLVTQGELQPTDSKTDLALASEGFFVVQTPLGERYTRDGQFHISPDGVLSTADGYPVLGSRGPIVLSGAEFTIAGDGTVSAPGIDPANAPRLRIVALPSAGLLREGQSLYNVSNGQAADLPPGQVDVRQGYLEKSTVDTARQLVQMVSVMRAYEANQKVIQVQDATLEKAVNEVGKTT